MTPCRADPGIAKPASIRVLGPEVAHAGSRVFSWPHGLLGATALVCVALQFPGTLGLTALALGLWLGALALFDLPDLRRIWRPRFLGASLLIAVLSGVLLGPTDLRVLGLPLSSIGLGAGALMLMRGVFIFSVTTWLAGRLASEGGRFEALGRLGSSLGAAVTVAIRLIPELSTRLPEALHTRGSRRWWQPGVLEEVAVQVVLQALRIAQDLASPEAAGSVGPSPGGQAGDLLREDQRPGPVARSLKIAVVGPRGSGKSTTLAALAEELSNRGLSVGGVVQPAVLDGTGRRYQLLDLATGARREFARRADPAKHALSTRSVKISKNPDFSKTTNQIELVRQLEIEKKTESAPLSDPIKTTEPTESTSLSESTKPADRAGGVCGFMFEADGWTWAAERIRAARQDARVLVVDELGRLEAEGGGHLPALLGPVTGETCGVWLLGVQAEAALAIAARLGGFDQVRCPAPEAAERDTLVQGVLELMRPGTR